MSGIWGFERRTEDLRLELLIEDSRFGVFSLQFRIVKLRAN